MSHLTDINVLNENNAWWVTCATYTYITFVAIGTVTVFLFIAVLIKGNSIFREFPFFSIVWNLAIVNAGSVFIQIACIVPSMFIDYDDDSNWADWSTWGTTVVSLSETATSFLVFLIALNRFSVFVVKQLSVIFTRENVKYSILVTWVAILVISYFRTFKMMSVTKFSKKRFEFTDILLNDEGPIYLIVISISYSVPACVFLMYIFIYIYLQKKRALLSNNSSDEKANNDKSLLLQGFALSISIIIWRTCQTISPRVDSSGAVEFFLSLLKSMAAVFNNILNPLLFFATNSTIRKTLKSLLKCESMKPKVVSDTDIPTARAPGRFHLKLKNPLKKSAAVENVVRLSNMEQMESALNKKTMPQVA